MQRGLKTALRTCVKGRVSKPSHERQRAVSRRAAKTASLRPRLRKDLPTHALKRSGTLAVVWAALLAAAGPAPAQRPPGPAEPDTHQTPGRISGVEVILKTVEPGVLRGRLLALTTVDGATLLADSDAPAPRRIPRSDLVRLIFVGVSAEAKPTADMGNAESMALQGDDVRLSLARGDLLVGRIVGGRADALLLKTEAFGPVPVPLEAISGVDTSRAALPTFADTVAWLDRSSGAEGGAARAGDDRVLLTNADVVRGFITRIDPDGMTIDNGEGDVRLPHRLVVAVRFASLGAPEENGPRAVVSCPGSGRLTLTELEWAGWSVKGRWLGHATVEMDARNIARVDFEDGRWEWLSQQDPASAEQVPMLSVAWEPRIDRNVLGGPISVAGERFERGIGVHARSRLVFNLDGQYARFVTLFGLDDNSGPLADVDVAIRVDGHPRYQETGVRRGRLFGPVRLDIGGAHLLELLVDFGENGDLQDRFNWVEPALVR